jgi:hypothetical protein
MPVERQPFHDPDYWTLRRLREAGYGTLVPPPPQLKDFQRVRFGKLRKTYSNASISEFLQFRPNRFREFEFDMPSEEIRSDEELSRMVDNRSLDELVSGANDSAKQMLIRAAAGDEEAIRFFSNHVRLCTRALEHLEKKQPEKLRTWAEQCPRWPVLLARTSPPAKPDDPKRDSRRYPKDLEAVLARLHKLNVGSKALIPSGPGRHPGSFWTHLAAWAAEECRSAATIVKIYEHKAEAADAKPRRSVIRLWNKPIEATYYYVREGSIVAALVITDWEKKCVSLTTPITQENFEGWNTVVREFVRECFHSSAALYKKVLGEVQTGQVGADETLRRNRALDYVTQALRILTEK